MLSIFANDVSACVPLKYITCLLDSRTACTNGLGNPTEHIFALLKNTMRIYLFFGIFLSLHTGIAVNTPDLKTLKQRVKHMFYHAYNGYMDHAYPLDELKPLTCDGHDTWGSVSLTLVDSLDTLVVLGNYSEFRRAASLVLKNLDPNKNVNVSVFETNIRGMNLSFLNTSSYWWAYLRSSAG